MMINLFFPYYSCGDTDRQIEIDCCLKRNIENKFINKIYILIDDESFPPVESSEKIEIIYLDHRPTYRKWIELSLSYCRNEYSILSNSDIYFNESIKNIDLILETERCFLALTRWEQLGDNIKPHPNPHWSQDSWGFYVGNDFSQSLLRKLDFSMGVPRCDNKIAYLFAVYGWRVINPLNQIISVHIHESDLRTYDKKLDDQVMGAVAYVSPIEEIGEESHLDVDIWMKKTNSIRSSNINKSMERWIAESKNNDFGNHSISRDYTFDVSSVDLASHLQAINNGSLIHDFGDYFKIYSYLGFYYFVNPYVIGSYVRVVIPKNTEHKKLAMVSGLIPSVITSFSDLVGDKPKNNIDISFWQYPCATEKQAFENHINSDLYKHVNILESIINIYIPLPWATYIDKKKFDKDLIRKYKFLIDKYIYISQFFSCELKIHTVCQHIHWYRILEEANSLGVTDLHLSHKTSTSHADYNCKAINLHGWPLIAVNYEIPDRNHSFEIKPLSDKKLLCSFVGAHMSHYRDQNRVILKELASALNEDDILVELGDQWHFNNHVYLEQVQNIELTEENLSEDQKKTINYNRVISDSIFSLCPEGAGPNTLRFWEAISIGSIPVLFSSDLSIFNDSETGEYLLSNCIVWEGEIGPQLLDYLRSISTVDLIGMSEKLIELYQHFRHRRCF